MGSPTYGYMADLIIFCMIIVQMFITFLEHHEFLYLSECGVGMMFGYLGGLLMYYGMGGSTLTFDKNFFFFVLLPVVIFSEGYIIKKRYFFGYFFYIAILGVFGTIITGTIIFLLNLCIDNLGFIYANGKTVHLTTYQLFIFSIILSSTETLAAKSFVEPNERPKLFNILYGEFVFSFVVSALNVVSEEVEDQPIYWNTYLILFGWLIFQIVTTALIGLFFGFLVTLITKHMRFLVKTDEATCAFILYTGYISFALTKSVGLAGVMSVLMCAVIVSHYMVYNISPSAQQLTIGTVKTLSYCCESLIFFYLGVCVAQYEYGNQAISWSFIFIEFAILIVARFGMVFGVASLVKLYRIKQILRCHIKSSKNFALNGYELTFISTAGVVRGSIVFAMIQYIHPPDDPRGSNHITYGCQTAGHRLLSETVHSVASSVISSAVSMASEASTSTSGHSVDISEELKTEIDKYCDDLLRIEVLRSTTLFMIFFTTYIFGILMKPVANYCLSKSEKHDELQSALTEEQKQDKKMAKQQRKQSSQIDDKKAGFLKKWFKYFDQKFLKQFLIYDYENRKDLLKREKAKYKEQENKHGGHGGGQANHEIQLAEHLVHHQQPQDVPKYFHDFQQDGTSGFQQNQSPPQKIITLEDLSRQNFQNGLMPTQVESKTFYYEH